jgi:hypothetical protein
MYSDHTGSFCLSVGDISNVRSAASFLWSSRSISARLAVLRSAKLSTRTAVASRRALVSAIQHPQHAEQVDTIHVVGVVDGERLAIEPDRQLQIEHCDLIGDLVVAVAVAGIDIDGMRMYCSASRSVGAVNPMAMLACGRSGSS